MNSIGCVVVVVQLKQSCEAKSEQQQQKSQMQAEINRLKSDIDSMKTIEKQFNKVSSCAAAVFRLTLLSNVLIC